MRIGWSVPLPGPFRASGTLWRSKPRRRRQRRTRFASPLYWLLGLVFIEAAVWVLAGELLGLWWLLWFAYRAAVMFAGDHWSVPGGCYRAVEVCRPVWPKRAEVTA